MKRLGHHRAGESVEGGVFHLCIRRSPNCPMAAKRAMRTVNAMPKFSPMRLVFNANSCECPLRPGQGLERRILPGPAARNNAIVAHRSVRNERYCENILKTKNDTAPQEHDRYDPNPDEALAKCRPQLSTDFLW